MSCVLARTLVGPLALFALLELILLAVFVLLLATDNIHGPLAFSLGTIDSLDATFAEASLVDFHDLVELTFVHVVALILDSLLEFGDHFHVVLLLLMLILHLEVLQRLVELFVLSAQLLLFECLDLDLLLQQAALHLHHVLVIFEHLCEEIIGSSYGDTCLHKESKPFHHVVAGIVVALLRYIICKALTRRFLF